LAEAAAARLLDILEFDSRTVERGKEERVKKAVPAQVPGYILARFADTYGRAVAFACKGKFGKPDGEPIFVDKALLHQTANYQFWCEFSTRLFNFLCCLRSVLGSIPRLATS
jgi:hypothetical protein